MSHAVLGAAAAGVGGREGAAANCRTASLLASGADSTAAKVAAARAARSTDRVGLRVRPTCDRPRKFLGMPRVKLLLNGARTTGKVCALPDNFAGLLERVSKKFTTDDTNPFVAGKLFTTDGFEVEEIDEVADGDTLVVAAAGEDFVPLELVGPIAPSTFPSVASSSFLK